MDYQERTYAAGRIPGSFFKREGRPSEKEILTSRLIDRPIRPLFPENFYNEVQIVATVLSSDNEVDADIPAMLGASAALVLSGIPFDGPIGAARVGYINGEYVLNPYHDPIEADSTESGGGRYTASCADGGVRGNGATRRNHAGRHHLWPSANAGGNRCHQ